MLNQSELLRIDKVLLDCISNVKQNMNHNQLGVLSMYQLIALENIKFGFKLSKKLLLTKVIECVQTNSVGNSLTKMHNYATRKKVT